MNLRLLLTIVLGMLVINGAHAETELSRAKSSQNPLAVNPEARYFTLPLNNYWNIAEGANKNTQYILDLKPVMPFPMTKSFDMIVRTIIPVMHQPANNGYKNGLGDINPTFFVAPAENRWLLWGIGPTVVLPTATNTALGAGKWSVGPELAVIAMPSVWTLAILTSNIWSVAGQANRQNVNQFSFQYFVTYNFKHGWYVTTQPTLTANWQATSGEIWTVPFGVGAGRSFQVGHLPMNIALQYYYNAVRPSTTEHWTLQFNLEFLFPDNRTV
jgi:hypothetical protein